MAEPPTRLPGETDPRQVVEAQPDLMVREQREERLAHSLALSEGLAVVEAEEGPLVGLRQTARMALLEAMALTAAAPLAVPEELAVRQAPITGALVVHRPVPQAVGVVVALMPGCKHRTVPEVTEGLVRSGTHRTDLEAEEDQMPKRLAAVGRHQR